MRTEPGWILSCVKKQGKSDQWSLIYARGQTDMPHGQTDSITIPSAATTSAKVTIRNGYISRTAVRRCVCFNLNKNNTFLSEHQPTIDKSSFFVHPFSSCHLHCFISVNLQSTFAHNVCIKKSGNICLFSACQAAPVIE